MLLSGTLFALFMMGFWLYCLTDAILTPAAECRGMAKPAWIAVIALTFIGGAIAWLIVREPADRPCIPAKPHLDDPADGHFRAGQWTDADEAVARHPAGRARAAGTGRTAPRGPDDDPEFLRALDRAIRGNSQAGEEV
jgi:peptidoglycan/LPS O-acetylase OafA/YrhL